MTSRTNQIAKKAAQNNRVSELENALERANRELNDLKSGTHESSGKTRVSAALTAAIKAAIKTREIWGKYKFYPSPGAHEVNLARQILAILQGQEVVADLSDKQEKRWIRDCMPTISMLFNAHRNYVVANLKRAAKMYEDEHGHMPSLNDMERCVLRKVDLENAKDCALYSWYWDTWLAYATGNLSDWAEDKRHYATICTAAPQDGPKKLYMTASNEAFAAVCFQNFREAWIALAKVKAANKGLTVKHQLNKLPTGADPRVGYLVVGKYIIVFGTQFKGKWTRSDSGSKSTGGWTREGVEAYLTLFPKVKEVRKLPSTWEFEEKFLGKLRQEYGITERSFAESQANRKRKRRQEPEEEAASAYDEAFLLGEDEDDDEEGDPQDPDPNEEDDGQNAGKDDQLAEVADHSDEEDDDEDD